MYKLLKDGYILLIEENAFIPPDPDNTYYRKYLEWLAEGNIPLPMDPPVIQYWVLIANIENQSMLNRGARELHMRLIEKEAAEQSTPEMSAQSILATQPYYVKLKEADDLIKEYRKHL